MVLHIETCLKFCSFEKCFKNVFCFLFPETAFCSQVPVSEYQRQTEECTNQSLVQMMNTIIDNPKMTLKEKKQRLQKFRKYHPNIYAKHFSGMV